MVGLLALAVGVVVIIATLWARLDDGERLAVSAGPNQPVNQDAASVAAHNSPSIVVSPVDPRTMAVAGRVDRPDFSASVHVSRDGGQTWSDSNLTLPQGQTRPFQPQLAFDARGTLFVLFSTLEGQGVIPGGLWLEGSRDAGRTFSVPVQVAGRFAYQPRLLIDQTTGNVHVTWLQAGEAVVSEVTASLSPTFAKRTPGLGPPPNPVIMATSRDGGVTFSERAQVSETNRERVGAATPALAANGDIYVLYQDFRDDVVDFQGLPGPVHTGKFSLVLARSTDAGRSFSTVGVAEDGVVPSERFLVYLPSFPSLAIDPKNGSLYVAWSDPRHGDSDVFVRRSDDGGRTWSEPVTVDNDKANPRQRQFLPRLAVAPNGRLDLLFLDQREDTDKLATAAVLATSVDEGKTWSTIALSDDTFDARVGPRNEQQEPDLGTHLGLFSTDDAAYAVWADTRRGTVDTDKQDLYFAPVRTTKR
ncbi:MAG TPA: sialidase family protein [Acidimicrobiales bacterium]|nr:sialidase family protein [Acidimicrobiales bacterium]